MRDLPNTLMEFGTQKDRGEVKEHGTNKVHERFDAARRWQGGYRRGQLGEKSLKKAHKYPWQRTKGLPNELRKSINKERGRLCEGEQFIEREGDRGISK